MKICIVGLGNHFQNTIEPLILEKKLKIHSVITQKKQINFKAIIFLNIKEALNFYHNENIIFYLCLPPNIHSQYLTVLQKFQHIIICEKPIFISLNDYKKFHKFQNLYEMMPYKLSKQYRYFKKLYFLKSDKIKNIKILFHIPSIKFKSFRNKLNNSLVFDQLCYPIDLINDLNIKVNKIDVKEYKNNFFNKSKLNLNLNNTINIDIRRGYNYTNKVMIFFDKNVFVFDFFFFGKKINKSIVNINKNIVIKNFNEDNLFLKFFKMVKDGSLKNNQKIIYKNIQLFNKICQKL